jgi:predicted lipoprotein with Yx(FWY)xxD motif
MNKALTIIVVLVVVIGGAYWLSTMSKDSYEKPATTNTPAENTSTNTSSNLKLTLKGPFGVVQDSTGSYLANKLGQALYINTKDQSNSSGKITASCDSACEKNWPPFLLANDEAAPDKSSDPLLSKLNLFKRADGKMQYALGTVPLYFYAGDKEAGETKGATVSGWALARP